MTSINFSYCMCQNYVSIVVFMINMHNNALRNNFGLSGRSNELGINKIIYYVGYYPEVNVYVLHRPRRVQVSYKSICSIQFQFTHLNQYVKKNFTFDPCFIHSDLQLSLKCIKSLIFVESGNKKSQNLLSITLILSYQSKIGF